MRALPYAITFVAIILIIAFLLVGSPKGAPQAAPSPPAQNQLSLATIAMQSTSSSPVVPVVATTTHPSNVARTTRAIIKKSPNTKDNSTVASSSIFEVARIQDPYSTAPLTVDVVNTSARAALVNIICDQRSGSFQPISGSGVIIDPRGVILTNAHVAQYVLLSETAAVNLSCYVRTGAPAQTKWVATVLYMPSVWVSQHASEITEQHPAGTGEHDYALLLITGSATSDPLPSTFPYLTPDTRNGIGFPGDEELVASYPAEFAGGISTQYGLYPATSVTTIGQLLTFGSGTVDAVSLGGIIEAQSGSSGGAVVNAWGRIIGIVATTSDAPTTGQRDLHAITLSYIDADIRVQTGAGIDALLSGDLHEKTSNFTSSVAPGLLKQFLSYLPS